MTTQNLPAPLVTLRTCALRPYHPSDIPLVAALGNNPAVARRLRPSFPSPYTLADATTWVSRCIATPLDSLSLSLVIADPETLSFCGTIGLRPLGDDESRTAEVGYWLGEPFWGRGMVTEATRGFARWVLEQSGEERLVRLEGHVYSNNEASKKVLSRAGFVLEGTRRKAGWRDGEVFDIYTFGLLREDLTARSE